MLLKRAIRSFSTFALLLHAFASIGQDTDPDLVKPVPYTSAAGNFVRSWSANAPITDPNILVGRPLRDVKQTTQYFDGLGCPLQTVARQGSLIANAVPVDAVIPVVYDEFGKETRKYLPFVANGTGGNTSVSDGLFKLNPFDQQKYFYSDNNPNSPVKGQGETFYYITGAFDNGYNSNFYTSYNTSPDYAQPITASAQTAGMVTWTETKVLSTSTYLYTANRAARKSASGFASW